MSSLYLYNEDSIALAAQRNVRPLRSYSTLPMLCDLESNLRALFGVVVALPSTFKVTADLAAAYSSQ